MDYHFEIIHRTHTFFDHITVTISYDVVLITNDAGKSRMYLIRGCSTLKVAKRILSLANRIDRYLRQFVSEVNNAEYHKAEHSTEDRFTTDTR